MNKALVVLTICATFGTWQMLSCSSGGAAMMASAQAAEIEIYTASYCFDCKRAKAYMKAQDIPFVEHDIERDIDRRREFYERGGKGIPLIFIGGQMMHGFEQEQFEKLRRLVLIQGFEHTD